MMGILAILCFLFAVLLTASIDGFIENDKINEAYFIYLMSSFLVGCGGGFAMVWSALYIGSLEEPNMVNWLIVSAVLMSGASIWRQVITYGRDKLNEYNS